MKKIHITTGNIGLVFKKGELQKILSTGSHWLFWKEKVEVVDLSQPFPSQFNLEVLSKNEALKEYLQVITIKDNEIVLVHREGVLHGVLTPGKYGFWKDFTEYIFTRINMAKAEISEAIDKNLLDKPMVLPYVRAYKIESYEKGLLFVDGIYQRMLAPGVYRWWKNSTDIQVIKADTRQLPLEISGQEILTRDKAQLRINFTLKYKIVDFIKAFVDNKDYERQIYLMVQLSLREIIGRMSFDELMDSKDQLSNLLIETAANKIQDIGVQLLDCGVKDIILPGDIKDIMNQVLIAEKKAQANSITRREETAATRSLLNTAKLMEENTMLWKLKEMEYIEKIADKIGEITVSGNGNVLGQLKEIFSK